MSEAGPSGYRTTRPALDVFDRDQDRLLFDGDNRRLHGFRAMSDGFETFWGLLIWYQAAGIRTLGHVEAVIEPRDILPESGLAEHLITPFDEDDVYLRRRLVERLDRACDAAYRGFAMRAEERVGDGQDTLTHDRVDPDRERNPLMRPAFRKLDDSQAKVLADLWTGFDDRQEVGRWVRSMTSVSEGNKPEGMIDEIVSSQPLLEAFLDRESASAQLTRYRYAVGEVLPAYLTAARSLHGGEQTDNDSGGHGAFST